MYSEVFMEEIWDILHIPTGTFFSDGYISRQRTGIYLVEYDIETSNDAHTLLHELDRMTHITSKDIELSDDICRQAYVTKNSIFGLWSFIDHCYRESDDANEFVNIVINNFNIHEYEICNRSVNYVKYRNIPNDEII